MAKDTAPVHPSDGRGLDVIVEPAVRRLADYWSRQRDGRSMPRRGDIDPIDIPWALSRLFLLDFEPDSQSFRYRLAGNDIEEVFRNATGEMTMKGRTVADILPPENQRMVQDRWMPVVTDRVIVYMHGMVYSARNRIADGGRVLLPLGGEDNADVTGVLGFTHHRWEAQHDNGSTGGPSLEIWHIPLDEVV